MSGHTPGPWLWRGKSGSLHQASETHPFGKAVLYPSWEYDSGVDTIVSDADAALIAAAPDLLEAAKQLDRLSLIIQSAVARNYADPDYGAVLAAIEALRAAAQKAEGAAP